MVDYSVDLEFMNCIPQISGARGTPLYGLFGSPTNADVGEAGRYIGNWVEKGTDYFIIYIAFATHDTIQENVNGFNYPIVPAPHSYTPPGQSSPVNVSERGGERFSAFLTMTEDILGSNPAPFGQSSFNAANFYEGYLGNPRVGKCTYPTITWKLNAISADGAPFFYGNLNTTDPVIQLNQN